MTDSSPLISWTDDCKGPESALRGCIHVLEGFAPVRTVPLDCFLFVGFSPVGSPQLRLTSDFVSARHGKFRRTDEHVFFADTGSRNGTWLNGKQLRSGQLEVLRDGDILRIGDMLDRGNENNVLMLFTDDSSPGDWRTYRPPASARNFAADVRLCVPGENTGISSQDSCVSMGSSCSVVQTERGWSAVRSSDPGAGPASVSGRELAPGEQVLLLPQDVIRSGGAWLIFDGVRFHVRRDTSRAAQPVSTHGGSDIRP